jgi:hypothetical protein
MDSPSTGSVEDFFRNDTTKDWSMAMKRYSTPTSTVRSRDALLPLHYLLDDRHTMVVVVIRVAKNDAR